MSEIEKVIHAFFNIRGCRDNDHKRLAVALANLSCVNAETTTRILKGYCVLDDEDVKDALDAKDWYGLWPVVDANGHIEGVTGEGGNAEIYTNSDDEEYMQLVESDHAEWHVS